MKFLRYKQYMIGLLALSLFASCDFEKINTNEFEMLPEEGKMDGISVGGPITALQKCVVPVGTQDDGTNGITLVYAEVYDADTQPSIKK